MSANAPDYDNHGWTQGHPSGLTVTWETESTLDGGMGGGGSVQAVFGMGGKSN
ncbi:MAG: hypothetical protein WBW31_18325 [Candidatus Sulfotelmatobacter sp.]